MGLNIKDILLDNLTSDPSPIANGCIWYRSDLKEFRKRQNGVTIAINKGGIGSVIRTPQDFVNAGGSVTAALVFIGDELAIRALGNGGTDTNIIVDDFMVPQDYVSGGELLIWVRRSDAVNSHTVKAWINNIIDITINNIDILATANLIWELKTIVFNDSISAGDVINLEVDSTLGNTEATYIKGLTFKYNN